MFKKITTHFLLLTLLVTVLIPNFNINANAEDAVTLKKGDKILIGNDYWRVLDPDHANNGEDGIFITLDTYNEKYKSLETSNLSNTDNFLSYWAVCTYYLEENWLNHFKNVYQGDEDFTAQYNSVMQYYYTYLDGYIDDYIIDTYKDSDENRVGELDQTSYWKNNFKPYFDDLANRYYTKGFVDVIDCGEARRRGYNIETKDRSLIGKISYWNNCSKLEGNKIFPLSVAELSNPDYFSNAEERKLYNSHGVSVNYWTRNHFLTMSEHNYIGYYKHTGYPTNGFSFVSSKDGAIIDDYTGWAYSLSRFNSLGVAVTTTRPAMNLKKDILSKLIIKESVDGVTTYYPDFAEDASIANVKVGDVIKMGGIEWIVLDPESTNYGGKGIFVIAKNYVSEFGPAIAYNTFSSVFVKGPSFEKELNDIYDKILKDKYGNYILNSSKGSDWVTSSLPFLNTLPEHDVNNNSIKLEQLFLPSINEIQTYLSNIEGADEYTSATSNELRSYWTRDAAALINFDGCYSTKWDFACFSQDRIYASECKGASIEYPDYLKHYLRPCMNLKYSALLALEENNEGLVSDISKKKLFTIKGVDESLDLSMTEDDGYVDKKLGVEDKIYRLYNNNTGEHLFTSSIKEQVKLKNKGWKYEEWSFEAYTTNRTEGLKPVYRVYNPNAKGGDHHYTKSKTEMNKLIKKGWKADFNGNPAFYCKGDKTTYKLYDKNSGRHHYTPKEAEANKLVKSGWENEGVAWEVSAYNSGETRVY